MIEPALRRGRAYRTLAAAALAVCAACASTRDAAPPLAPAVAAPARAPAASDVVLVEPAGAKVSCPAGTVAVPGGDYLPSVGAAARSIATLCVDVTEVTVDAYAGCVVHTGCLPAPTDPRDAHVVDASCNVSDPTRGGHPINCIDAGLASLYCKARGMRLPDDVEWWWIARSAGEGRRFAWGDDAAAAHACWSGPGMLDGTCGAGSHPDDVTAQGVLDMGGNVSEWTRISAPPEAGPVDGSRPLYRVHGGSFVSRDAFEVAVDSVCGAPVSAGAESAAAAQPITVLRVGPREHCARDALRSPVVGFRCVREAPPTQ